MALGVAPARPHAVTATRPHLTQAADLQSLPVLTRQLSHTKDAGEPEATRNGGIYPFLVRPAVCRVGR